MKPTSDQKNAFIDQTISQRTGFGPNEMIKGWQDMLGQLLGQMQNYLKPSRIITFRNLSDRETVMYERIVQAIVVPENVCGVYISPGVRNQMLYTNQGKTIPDAAKHPADDGVLLFNRTLSYDTIVNALLAHPPHTPAIDVYEKGAMLAGYVYDSIAACLTAASEVIATHLGAASRQGP